MKHIKWKGTAGEAKAHKGLQLRGRSRVHWTAVRMEEDKAEWQEVAEAKVKARRKVNLVFEDPCGATGSDVEMMT